MKANITISVDQDVLMEMNQRRGLEKPSNYVNRILRKEFEMDEKTNDAQACDKPNKIIRR